MIYSFTGPDYRETTLRLEDIFTITKPSDLCIGDLESWNQLLSLSLETPANNEPEITDLEQIARSTKDLAKLICIRFGTNNLGKEALFHGEELLYIKDTGYETIDESRREGFAQQLTAMIIEQFFLGAQSWLYNDSLKFTMPLSILEMTPETVPKDAKILDIGCGYGRAIGILKEKGFTNLHASDISISMVQKTRELYPDINVHHASVHEFKEQNHKYDVCLLLAVLTTIQHDHHLIAIVDDIAEILEDNGILLVSDFGINTDDRNRSRYERYVELFPDACYGSFITQNGMINRHFHKEFMVSLLERNFTITNRSDETFKTVNGNTSNGFMISCKKK